MRRPHADYELDDDPARLDLKRVQRWLASSYWSPGIELDTVERAVRGSSLVVGAYAGQLQVGNLRVVSDKATFAWVCDVFVDDEHRGLGIARAMLRFAQEHPEHQGLRQWLLGTQDAHGVYAAVGFLPLDNPQRMMRFRPVR